MVLDAFVFESDQPKARAVGSVRIATHEEIDPLIAEIRQQGNARIFPIILRQILLEAVKTGCKIEPEQLKNLSRELTKLEANSSRLRKFKSDLRSIIKIAQEFNRPIIF